MFWWSCGKKSRFAFIAEQKLLLFAHPPTSPTTLCAAVLTQWEHPSSRTTPLLCMEFQHQCIHSHHKPDFTASTQEVVARAGQARRGARALGPAPRLQETFMVCLRHTVALEVLRFCVILLVRRPTLLLAASSWCLVSEHEGWGSARSMATMLSFLNDKISNLLSGSAAVLGCFNVYVTICFCCSSVRVN